MSKPFKFQTTPQEITDVPIVSSAPAGQKTSETPEDWGPNSIGAQLKAKGIGNIDAKVRRPGSSSRNHEGNGKKVAPGFLRAEIEDIHKLEKDAEKHLTKLRNDKEGVLFILAGLKIKVGQLSESVSEAERNGYLEQIKKTEGWLAQVNRELPNHSPSEDQNELESKIKRWEAGERDWEREKAQAKSAENRLKNNPADGKAMGRANRARTEKAATELELKRIAQETRDLVGKNQPPSLADQEGISYTHEKAVSDRKEWEEKHKKAQADAVLEAVPADDSLSPQEVVVIPDETPNTVEAAQEPAADTTSNDAPAILNNVPAEATANDWQEEAITNFEETGKTVPNWDFIPEKTESLVTDTPNETDSSSEIPTLTEMADAEFVGPPRQEQLGQEVAFEKFEFSLKTSPDLTPKQADLIAQLEKTIDAIQNPLEERVVAAKAEGPVRRMGKYWKELSLPTKLLVSGVLIGGGYTAGLAAAPVVIGAGIAVRLLGAAALFLTVEEKFKNDATKKSGAPLTDAEEARSTLLAGALAIVVAGLLPAALHEYAVNPLLEKLPDFPTEKPLVEATAYSDSSLALEQKLGEANLSALSNVPETDSLVVAETGDSRWSMSERALASGPYADEFNAIESTEERTHIIDAIKDKLTQGMTVEQANLINVGEEIDFSKIFEDKDFMDNIFSNADNLTPAQIENIQNYEATPQEPSPSSATMPAEMQPQNSAMVAGLTEQANKILSNDLDQLFGSSKFLGFGFVAGAASMHWKDPKFGFANKTIGEIENARPVASSGSGEKTYGINNREAKDAILKYVGDIEAVSGISRIPTETVSQSIERALLKTSALPK